MTMPNVSSELETKLDEIIREGAKARRAGDFEKAVSSWESAWELLPDPKLSWDYYGQKLTRELANGCIESGDLAAAARWVELCDEAYSPHSDASRMLVDFVKAKLFHRAGQHDLAFAYFDAIYKVKGKQVFDGEAPDHYEFYRSYQPGDDAAAGQTVGVQVPEPGVGAAQAVLDDATHDRVLRHLAEADNYLDLDAPDAAAEELVAGLELLPDPKTQWEHALNLYAFLGDALLAQTQFAEAERALRYALESPEGTGNPYVWLRLGDALRLQDRDGEALEAYTSGYMLAGDELFEDEDEALAMLDAAGIREA